MMKMRESNLEVNMFINKKICSFLPAAIFMLGACSKGGDERLKERADIESRKAAENSVLSENENLANRAQRNEARLAHRQKFFTAVKGFYEGSFVLAGEKHRIRITLTPTVFPLPDTTVRHPDEVTHDLEKLNFGIQVQQWLEGSTLSGGGCSVEGLNPDLKNGNLQLISGACGSLFLAISDKSLLESTTPREQYAESIDILAPKLVSKIFDGVISSIPAIAGFTQSNANAETVYFIAERVERP